MSQFDFKILAPSLKGNTDGAHVVYSYSCRLFTYLSDLKIQDDDDVNKKTFDEILAQLNNLVDFYNNNENLQLSADHLSVNLDKMIAKNYILTFSLLKNINNSSLFDTANKFITFVMANDKKNNLFTTAANETSIKKQILSLIILEQLFEIYGYELPSLAPILIQYCYKSIKVILSSSKTAFSCYSSLLQLSNLLSKVLRNNGDTTIDSSNHGKILKVTKQLIKYLVDVKDVKNFNSTNGINLPIIAIGDAFDILGHLINSEKKYSTINTKTHKDKNIFVNQFSKEYNNYVVMGFISNLKPIRHAATKFVAELLNKNLARGNIPNLANVLAYYNSLYLSTDDITVRTSVFVSLIHFTSLNDVSNKSFLFDSFFQYLDSFKELMCSHMLYLQTFNNDKTYSQIYWFYENFYLKSLGQFNKSIILQKIIDSEYLNNEPLLMNSPNFVQVLLKLLEFLIKDLGPTMTAYQEQLKMILLKLICDRNFLVRIQAINTFVYYCQYFPNQVQSILNHCLIEVQNVFRKVTQVNSGTQKQESEVQVETSHFVIDFGKIHGYANCIASLIRIINKDYVSQDVVARTLTFASSQLKSVSTITSSNLLGNNKGSVEKSITEIQLSFNKRMISWILLTGLMNYDESFIRIHISQFFIFWKNLLTHNYQSTLSSTSAHDYKMVKARMDEIFRNLEIRNYSLTCLLNFLSNITITPEIAKQSSYLLSKCLSYINSLEANLSSLSGKEREESYNSEKEKVILLHKKRVLQCYVKLSSYIKNDLNSSILIFALKNFSDPEVFHEELHSMISVALKDKERDKEKELKIHRSHVANDKSEAPLSEDLNNNDLYLVNDGLTYGLTSKLNNGFISELSVKFSKADRPSGHSQESIDIDSMKAPPGAIQSKESKSHYVTIGWVDKFEEKLLLNPFTASISNDYLLKIYDESYSNTEEFSYGLDTSIIDLSIEIFSLIFPYLSSKIQQSLLEQMRGNLLRKKTSRMRMKSININSSIALHGVLSICQKHNVQFEPNVVATMMETLKVIDLKEPFIFEINANSIALLSSQFPDSQERVEIHITDIVSNNNPYTRSADALIIANLYKLRQSQFNSILEVLLSLIADPHPVVNYWSLYSLITLVDSHLSASPSLCSQILESLEKIVLNDDYTIYKSSNLTSNFSLFYRSKYVIARLLRSIIIALGPNIREIKPRSRDILSNLLISSLFIDNDPIILRETLKSIQNLMVFDKSMFSLKLYVKVLNYLLKNSLKTCLGNKDQPLPILNETNEIFTFTSGTCLLNTILNCYSQLIKIFPVDEVLNKDIKQFLWLCVDANPDSADLKFLIKYWFESSVDIRWFSILNTLYKVYRTKLYDELYNGYKSILTKHDKKEVKVELQDEEIESMAKGAEDNVESPNDNGNRGNADDDNVGSDAEEPSSHKFKLFVLELIQLLLLSTRENQKLYLQFQPRIQDLVKVAFSGCTSTIMSLRLIGVDILGDIITIYGDAKDPLYDSVSLLEQQQAQITAALTPAFTSESSTELASEAINVCAKFVGSNIVPVDKCGRILRILIKSLEEFSSQGEPKIGDIEISTIRGKRRIKLSVLNAWAELKIYSQNQQSSAENQENSEQIGALVDKYLEILVPMWILSLREYANLKYSGDLDGSGDKKAELLLYEACWINFVDVIGCIIEEQEQLIFSLLENDAGNFFFVLYAQCIEVLIKPSSLSHSASLFTSKAKNNFRVLSALNKLLHSRISSDIIFQDQVFSETIDLFDRLIIVSEDEEKSVIIDIISGLFLNYFNLKNNVQDFTDNIDKLFELLRVIMIAVTNIIPFVGDDYVSQAPHTSSGAAQLTDIQQTILKKSFSALVVMIERFPIVMKVDLIACLLYIMSLVYLNSDYRNVLVPIILSNLKSIITILYNNSNKDLINHFYQMIRPTFVKNNNNSVLTLMVLVTSVGDSINFEPEDIDLLVDSLTHSLLNISTLQVAIQSIKSLILYATKNNSATGVAITKKLIPLLVEFLIEKHDEIEDPRLIIEMIVLYSKQFSDERELVPIFTIIITLICWYDDKLGNDFTSGQFRQYLHTKLMNLLMSNSTSFKIVVNDVLSADQKVKTENLVKFKIDEFNSKVSDDSSFSKESHIKLKTFGK
ncbi:Laa1 protein [Saccharomycopsis crataegensis]|uniref:Laa1 protein n=1 Tax=Saccharomycopsis crataegensis TaxID=43959 RepID=A0AAV5QMH9_9ASCO|nr:Laa1 protein [Saccharomycopsis crataegensis]